MQESIEVSQREDSMYSTPEKHSNDPSNVPDNLFLAAHRSTSVGCSKEVNRRTPTKKTLLQKSQKKTRRLSEVIHLTNEATPPNETCQFTPCFNCQCYLPPRAHHCKRCGRCILRRDHHCIWLGTCIGFKNHKYFILLLHYQFLFLLLISLEVALRLLQVNSRYMIIYIVFLIITVPEFVLVFALCVFHTRLLCVNMTSLERVKYPNQVLFVINLIESL